MWRKIGRKVRYQVHMMRMVDGWYGIDMYVIRSMTWLGFSLFFQGMHFIFFDSFCYIPIFFSLSHRTCYLEGIVSLLLVWSVYSYVFFLSVLFVCCCSSPSSSKL